MSTLERQAREALDTPMVQLTRASAIRCVPIRWLWRDWLARGKLHILAGPAGTGKTTIALAIGAVITRGGQWPDGTVSPPGRVLLWSGEDDPADTLVPRLRAAGADLDRVLIVGDALTDDEPRPFDPARDLAALEWQLERYNDIALLIADPVVSAIGGADSHKNTEVRRALQPLVNLGQRLGCAVLGISHFSKGTAGRDPTERVTGSVAFGALARVVLVTAKAEDGGRLLARSKSNIGPDGGGFSYGLEMTCGDGMEASRVQWGGALEGTARELLGDAEAVADSPRDDAVAWLTDALSAAEVPVAEIKAEARAAGLAWRTVERAKAEIGVVARRVNGDTRGAGYWTWGLPIKSATTNTANPTANVGGLEETAQRRGFPGDSAFKTANSECGGLGAALNVEQAEEVAEADAMRERIHARFRRGDHGIA